MAILSATVTPTAASVLTAPVMEEVVVKNTGSVPVAIGTGSVSYSAATLVAPGEKIGWFLNESDQLWAQTASAASSLLLTYEAAAGGGPSSAIGATVRMSGSIFVNIGGQVPFDTEVWDSGGFIDSTNHRLVVPSGEDGIYMYGFILKTGALTVAAGNYIDGSCIPAGSAPNIYAVNWPFASTSDGFVVCSIQSVARFAAGDTLDVVLDFKNGSDTSLNLDGDDCALFLARLGT